MPVYVLNVARDITPATDGVLDYQLEPLPLHGLLISLFGAVTAANVSPDLSNLQDMLPNIEIQLAGTTLWQTSCRDACDLMPSLIGANPLWMPNTSADNSLNQLKLYIPFGRSWYSRKWALPATPAGQLRLRLTGDIATTGLDGLTYSVDAVHNDSLQPEGFLRTTTLSRVAGAVGDLQQDLPVGRWLSGVGIFGTTERITLAGANGINRLKLLRDAVEIRYPSIEWGTAQLLNWLRCASPHAAWQHRHESDLAAAYTQFQLTAGPQTMDDIAYSSAFLDFDPLMDGSELLDLRTCNRCVLQPNMGTAEAIRILPVEWWPNTQLQQPALSSGMG